jgi:MFS transporter, DHA2 family, glioxin efflux transporter
VLKTQGGFLPLFSSGIYIASALSDRYSPPKLLGLTTGQHDGLDPEKQSMEAEKMASDPEKLGLDTLAEASSTHEKEAQPDELAPQLSRIDTSDYPKAFSLAMIVVALVLAIFLVSLDMTIVATAIPRITDQFHSLDQVGWYGSAFFLTLAAFQSTWGKAYKYFPLKTSFLVSIFIFEIGSLICGVAQSSTTLIVGRAIAGVGGAGIASGSYFSARLTASNTLAPP